MDLLEKHCPNQALCAHLTLALQREVQADTSEPLTPLSPAPTEGRRLPRRHSSTSLLRGSFYTALGMAPHGDGEELEAGEGSRHGQPELTRLGSEVPLLLVEGSEQPRGVLATPSHPAVPEDLFDILFRCQAQAEPVRYMLGHAIAYRLPLLAVLAGCVPEASLVACACAYLAAGPDSRLRAEAREKLVRWSDGEPVLAHRLALEDLTRLLREQLEAGGFALLTVCGLCV